MIKKDIQKIFLVEDEDDYAGFIQKSLEKVGNYSVEIFKSGELCLAEIKRNNLPSVILIDYYLPGMNGLELYTAIRKKNKTIQLIIMSSNTDANLVVEMVKKGIRKYVIKNENVIISLKALLEENDDLFIDLH
jgi:DNA-binding NtrC family response regulator